MPFTGKLYKVTGDPVNVKLHQLLVRIPFLLTCAWLWLYVAVGFLLKGARRFDVGFDWFNRHADIEKEPLSSIGLVAGAIVAMVYWSIVVISPLAR